MSTTIEEWQVIAFGDNVHHLTQQMDQVTMGTTMVKTGVVGTRQSFDRLAPADGIEGRRSRFAPTPNIGTEESRRWAYPISWVYAKLLDDEDAMRQIHMPMNEYAKQAAGSKNRFRDKITVGYDALDTGTFAGLVGGALGLAWHGEEVLTQVALPTTQIIPPGGAALTKAKIVRTHALFLQNNYDRFLHGARTFVYDPYQLNFLLNDSELTSAEFMSVQTLMSGLPAPGLLGFDNWVRYNGLPSEGNIQRNVAYAENAIGVAVWMDDKRRAGERADLSYAMQIYIQQALGSVRIDDKLVVGVDVDTSIPLPT